MGKYINTKNFDVIEYDGVPKGEDWVKIPDDSEVVVIYDDNEIAAYKDNFEYMFHISNMYNYYVSSWVNSNWEGEKNRLEHVKISGGKIVWQREDVKPDKHTNDLVNHPKHYTEDPSGVECIELTSCLSAPISNSLKYVWRCGLKDDDVQELGKAMFYLDYTIENNIDVGCNGMNETLGFEQKVKQVLSHWSGWKYIFLNALYWNDKEQMKRALAELLDEAKSKSC